VRVAGRLLQLGMLPEVGVHALLHLRLPAAPLLEGRPAAVDRLGALLVELLRRRPLRRQLHHVELAGGAPRGHQHCQNEHRNRRGAHIRADSRTMPRSTTRTALPRSWASVGGTSEDSASCLNRSRRRRMARMRSPSWPPKESSTMLDQSSSPDAHRYTDGMNPVEISTGIGRRYIRCASATLSATVAISPSFRLDRGCLRRNNLATALSPDLASSTRQDRSVATSASGASSRMPRSMVSATSSSLSWRRPAMSCPFGRSLPSFTAPKRSST